MTVAFGNERAGDKHHRRRQVEGYLLDSLASGKGYLFKDGNDSLGLRAAYGCHKRTFASMGVTVCDEGVKFSATER